MKILFIVPHPMGTVPGQRFRHEQYLNILKINGIKYKVCPFISRPFMRILYKRGYILLKIVYTVMGYIYRLMNIIEGLHYDIIYIHRESAPLGPSFVEYVFHLLGKPLIFDFDDTVYLPVSSDSNRIIKFLKNSKKANSLMKMSNCILAGNKNLMNYTKKFNKNVLVMPTVINTDIYSPRNTKSSKRLCIGWSGSRTTVAYVNIIKTVIKALSAKHDITFKIIGSKKFDIEGMDVKTQEWNLETEVEDLQELDIGVMPLWDDEWSRGKCGLKALQYMALGIPTVCSPVGVNADIIQDGVNGFLANTDEEWFQKLSLLIENPKLRQDIGEAGRKTVEKYYSVKVYSPRFVETLKKVCNSGDLGCET